jgi:hypothetical protein
VQLSSSLFTDRKEQNPREKMKETKDKRQEKESEAESRRRFRVVRKRSLLLSMASRNTQKS